MNWIAENWTYIVLLGAMVAVSYAAITRFLSLPRKDQEERIRAFLVHSVTMAEKEFGSKTGKLKLSSVYNDFLVKFGWLALVFPYEKFERLVDDVLVEARKMWEQNDQIKQIIEGENG